MFLSVPVRQNAMKLVTTYCPGPLYFVWLLSVHLSLATRKKKDPNAGVLSESRSSEIISKYCCHRNMAESASKRRRDAGIIPNEEAAWDRNLSKDKLLCNPMDEHGRINCRFVSRPRYPTFWCKHWITACMGCSTKFQYSLACNFLCCCFYWKPKVWQPLVMFNWSQERLSAVL